MTSSKLLVCVLSYNAENFIRDTLERIPPSLGQFDTHVLVIDDASTDRGYEIACEIRDAGFIFPLTVLKNSTNQGYGGNAKLGILYAINEGFDAVALTHGDGQYPPEMIPGCAPPVLHGEVDAVFGSRMLNRKDALKGRMPLYKFFGNIFLTTFQNYFLKTKFSEFHTGFRIYATAAMKRIPYNLASNYFDFDTDVTLQFIMADLKIKEMPIDTNYGEETSHVNVFKYGLIILRSTMTFWAHKRGIYYQRKFDVSPREEEEQYVTPRVEFPEAHKIAVEHVPSGSRVLDVGSGYGEVCRELQNKDCHVTGLDLVPPPAPVTLNHFIKGDIVGTLPERFDDYDVVLLLDVLSFSQDPEQLLQSLHHTSTGRSDGLVIITSGNVGFITTRIAMLFGNLNYARRGLIHYNHFKLFTRSTLIKLLEDNGFKVEKVTATPAPYARVLGVGVVASFLDRTNRLLMKMLPGLFSYRLVIEARPRSVLSEILAQATKDAKHNSSRTDKVST